MARYWFKAKQYGWGWTPCTWQGWLILLSFVAVTVQALIDILQISPSLTFTIEEFVPVALFNGVILIMVCWFTGEKPRWRWGKK